MSPLKQETMGVGLALHLEGAITTSAKEDIWEASDNNWSFIIMWNRPLICAFQASLVGKSLIN